MYLFFRLLDKTNHENGKLQCFAKRVCISCSLIVNKKDPLFRVLTCITIFVLMATGAIIGGVVDAATVNPSGISGIV